MSFELSNTTTIILCLIILLLICCCLINPVNNEHLSLPLPPVTSEKIQESFFKNYKDSLIAHLLNDQHSNNFVFSPRSLKEGLSLLYLGSTGSACETLGEYFDNIQPELIIVYYKNNDNQLMKSGSVKIANSLWTNNNIKLRIDYLNIAKGVASTYSFNSFTENVQNRINSWVTQKTNGMITDAPFDKNSSIVIINTLYFNDKWKYPFEKFNTKQEQFFITKKNFDFIYIPMMFQKLEALYYDDDTYSSISLPYVGPFAMIITIDSRGYFLTNGQLSNLITKMRKRNVNVKIPKFTCENEMDLVPVLKQVNMGNIFTPNYFKMINDPTVFADRIIQKVKIEVDESGTKAAASTVISIKKSAYPVTDKEKWFIANIPFNYYIIYSLTQEILFMGRYKGIR